MEITEIKIIEIGTDIEIRMMVNDIRFYTHYRFSTKEEARNFLKEHRVKEW